MGGKIYVFPRKTEYFTNDPTRETHLILEIEILLTAWYVWLKFLSLYLLIKQEIGMCLKDMNYAPCNVTNKQKTTNEDNMSKTTLGPPKTKQTVSDYNW